MNVKDVSCRKQASRVQNILVGGGGEGEEVTLEHQVL